MGIWKRSLLTAEMFTLTISDIMKRHHTQRPRFAGAKKHRRIIFWASAVVALAVLFAGYQYWLNDREYSQTLASAVDKLTPPADWQLTSEIVRPYPKVGWQCLDSGGCPYIEKTWKVKHVVTTEEINQLTKEYAGMAKEKIDCALTPDDSLPTTACYAEFNLKDVRMSVGADIISKNESKVSVYANEN